LKTKIQNKEVHESGMKNKIPRHGSASRGTNSSKKQPLSVHAENLQGYARQRNELFQYELAAGCWHIYSQKPIMSF